MQSTLMNNPSNPINAFPRPSLWQIFVTWLTVGGQSFGGGSSTFYLIHQACIARGWVTEEEFVRTWALAQISPGINLIKLTVLVAHRLRGWPGLLAGVTGLLLPSAGVTVLMTAGFAAIRSQPLVKAAMRGILPATIGLSLAMAYQMAQPLFTRAYREGYPRLTAHLVITATSALMLALGSISPVLVLAIAGVVTMLAMAVLPARQAAPARKEAG
jgi:chromate transporter